MPIQHPPFVPTRPEEVVERALMQRGLGRYQMGGGAPYWEANMFAPKGNQFDDHGDCTALCAYAARYIKGRYNTDALVDDAIERVMVDDGNGGRYLKPTGRPGRCRLVRLVGRSELVRAGDLIVKPGPDKNHDGERDHAGHAGVITKVLAAFVRGSKEWWEDLEVTHCSGAGQDRIDPATKARYGAVRTQDASRWWDSGYILRPLHVNA